MGFLIVLALILFGVYAGLVRIMPVHKGVLQILGTRTDTVFNEGWVWVFPWVCSIYSVDMHEITFEVRIPRVFTPDDQAEMEATIKVTYLPNEKNLIKYINVKNHQEMLTGKIEEAVRSFPNKPAGPRVWRAAVKMTDEFGAAILAAIGKQEGDGSTTVPDVGVVVSRLNVVSIQPNAALREALGKIGKETAEREAEGIQATTTAVWIRSFLGMLGLSPEQISDLSIKAFSGSDEIATRLFTQLTNLSLVDRQKATQAIKRLDIDLGQGADKSLNGIAQAISAVLVSGEKKT
jgi:regulator of protease activity HflC (stomatin/prohibitin superfamily)